MTFKEESEPEVIEGLDRFRYKCRQQWCYTIHLASDSCKIVHRIYTGICRGVVAKKICWKFEDSPGPRRTIMRKSLDDAVMSVTTNVLCKFAVPSFFICACIPSAKVKDIAKPQTGVPSKNDGRLSR